MKKERIKDLLNLDENNFKLDEKDKEKVRKKHQAKQQNGDKASSKEAPSKKASESKKDPEPKKEDPKPEEESKAEEPKSKEEPKEGTDQPKEKAPADEKDVTKKVWQNILTMIWNNHPNKNKQDVLKATLIDVLKAMDWDKRHGKKDDTESEAAEDTPNTKGEGNE